MPKRILFLTPHYPYPPHQGGALRNFGMIEGLARRKHLVSLLSFIDPDQTRTDDEPLSQLCHSVTTVTAPTRTVDDRLRDLMEGHADMTRRFWSLPFVRALNQVTTTQPFDVIIVSIEMVNYIPPIHEQQPQALLIYDALNAEYDLQWRIALHDLKSPRRWPAAVYSMIQTRRLENVETGLCRDVSHVLACSEADAAKLKELRHKTPVTVIPNAIHVNAYQQEGDPTIADIPHPALVFTGKMDFRPNIDAALWLADEILPAVRVSHPKAHLTIVGQKPHARLNSLRGRDGITLTGYVPDVKPYLNAADVYVAPLRMGSGTRFKLLEAMAMGKAIVSTRLGAEGLSVENGKEMILADSTRDFAMGVSVLLGDQDKRRKMGEAAMKKVSQHYDWDAIIPKLEAIFTS